MNPPHNTISEKIEEFDMKLTLNKNKIEVRIKNILQYKIIEEHDQWELDTLRLLLRFSNNKEEN